VTSAEGSTSQVAARLAVIVAGSHDRGLRCETLRLLINFAWAYRPGRIWRAGFGALAEELGMAPRTMRRARAQLLERGYIARLGDGWIIPLIEERLPLCERADPRRDTGVQRELPFLAAAPTSARRYLRRA